jgi:hypothetical protein
LSSSSSSSSDEGDPSGAAAERIESEDAEIAAAKTVFSAENIAAEASSTDESTASSTSSEDEDVVVRTSTEEDKVSMDELKAAEAVFYSTSTTSASEPRLQKGPLKNTRLLESLPVLRELLKLPQ